jgi:hypothetical protein
MAPARSGYQRPGTYSTGTTKSKPKYIQPRAKLSALGKAYNKVRWLCYFLPLFGFIMIWYSIYLALFTSEDIIIVQTLIAAAGVMTYLAIYYNKRI